ncbi:MAG: hypothetical protein NTZ73_02675 [Candidatus Diapherotrites archaeon]|nr:hypothetical protein [Candidatus Diapherotrites archaeon]
MDKKPYAVWASCCGNAFLFGEYAVLLGKNAIVLGLSGPLTAHASFSKKDEILSKEFKKSPPAEFALKSFRELYGYENNVSILIDSKIPAGKGFGSSDACMVSTFAALSKLYSAKLSNKKLLKILFALKRREKLCSAGALAATIYGGLVRVNKNKCAAVEKLNKPTDFLFTYTRKKSKGMIEPFMQRYEKNKSYKKIVSTMDSITKSAWRNKNNYRALGELMGEYQCLLENIGVSNEHISNLIYESQKEGAIGTKISGAGGGDCIVSLAPKKLGKFEHANETYRFSYTRGLK